jgi:hypothetical protein
MFFNDVMLALLLGEEITVPLVLFGTLQRQYLSDSLSAAVATFGAQASYPGCRP